METAIFLFSALVISLSGVMAPGTVTAAAIAHGARRRDAGILIALGHGIIEFPLMFLIILGFAAIIESSAVQVAIGIVGGLFLLWMGVQMIREIRREDFSVEATCKSPPLLTGLILSAGNPYFLLWWATVGLKLATDARQLGWIAFVLFTIVHWLCDLVWLGFLGWMSYGGAKVLGNKSQRIILGVCGTALILFSIKFVYSAGALWVDVLQRA